MAGRDPGLQPERTQLSWERTAWGFLAVGALVLLRHGELPFAGRLGVAVLAAAMASAVMVMGRRMAVDGGAPRAAIVSLAWLTVGLAIAVVGLIAAAPG